MKIITNKLVDFLEKSTLNGVINTSVLNFTDDRLKVMLTTANIAFVRGNLKKKVFQEYEAIGEVGVKNNSLFISLLKRYGAKVVKLEVQENKLVIVSETGSTYYVLADKESIDNHIATPNIPFEEKLDGGFNISAGKFVDIKKGADIIKTKEIVLEVKDKVLKLIVTSEVGDIITEEVACDYKDVKGKYGSLFLNIIDVIEGTVNVSLNDDFPIRIREATDEYRIDFFVAPLVDNQE